MSYQATLLGTVEPEADPTFASATRVPLPTHDGEAWVDHVPEWLAGGDELFERVVRLVEWNAPTVHMYERTLEQPRLSGSLRIAGRPPVIDDMRKLLSARYDVEFTGVGANLYRDGNDSVAWHGDRVARDLPVDCCVAVLSLGGRRTFLMRPKGGGNSIRFDLGSGDLLVMGGSCQRTWEHCVPKVARADARMSLTFRHAY